MTKSKWYKKKIAIITLIILCFPVGLVLMWKYGHWSKTFKLAISLLVPFLLAIVLVVTYNSSPTITVNKVTNGTITTESSEYDITGRVSSMKDVTLKINDIGIPLADDYTFSYKVRLEEGDNNFLLVATNDNGETIKEVTIRRLTQSEIDARAIDNEVKEEKITNNNSDAEIKMDETAKPAYSSEDFTDWSRTEIIAFYKDSFSANQDEKQERWAYINSKCSLFKDIDRDGDADQYYDKDCLQAQYKDYIKPEAFAYGSSLNNTEWVCPKADEKYYSYICSRFGDLLEEVKAVSFTGTGTELARIYERIDKIYQEVAVLD